MQKAIRELQARGLRKGRLNSLRRLERISESEQIVLGSRSSVLVSEQGLRLIYRENNGGLTFILLENTGAYPELLQTLDACQEPTRCSNRMPGSRRLSTNHAAHTWMQDWVVLRSSERRRVLRRSDRRD